MTKTKNLLAGYGISNIINYLRKSRQDEERERKTGEDTLHEQKLLMDRVLSEYGIPYDQEEEIGSGDKIATRPVFQQVIIDLENGKYDAIAVKDISRMGRGSYSDMGVIYDLITEKRIFVVTPWKVYDPSNPSDLRQIRFELFMSREEFESTKERLWGGRYNAAIEGKWVAGAAPFGYDYDSTTKRLVINEEEAKVVRMIFDYYVNGIVDKNGKRKLVQFRALATFLKRVGIKTPRGKDEWHPVQLRRFLSNERYIGTIRFNVMQKLSDGSRVERPEDEQIAVENAHPAIIDTETWDKAQYRIENRDTTNVKLDFEVSELAGLCVCKVCGRKMVRQYSVQHYKKKDGTTSVYHKEFLWCTKQGCTFLKYRSIEDDLIETLKYLKSLDKKALEKRMKSIIVKKKKPENYVEKLKQQVETRKKELERRMKFIFEKFETGVYTDEMFLERKEEIDKEMKELQKAKFNESTEEEKQTLDVDMVKLNIETVLSAYRKAKATSEKNELLRSVFDHVEVEVIKKGRGRRPAIHETTPYLKDAIFNAKRL